MVKTNDATCYFCKGKKDFSKGKIIKTEIKDKDRVINVRAFKCSDCIDLDRSSIEEQ